MSASSVRTLVTAVFSEPPRQVLEAYSEYDRLPLQFPSAADLVSYIDSSLAEPSRMVFFFVVYPDMQGVAVQRAIPLDPAKVEGHRFRYTWDGWGMISVQLGIPGQRQPHHITANSESRAQKWASTYPEWAPPSSWNWPAVQRHTRRLQRILKSLA